VASLAEDPQIRRGVAVPADVVDVMAGFAADLAFPAIAIPYELTLAWTHSTLRSGVTSMA
jgi:hypothetical protein